MRMCLSSDWSSILSTAEASGNANPERAAELVGAVTQLAFKLPVAFLRNSYVNPME